MMKWKLAVAALLVVPTFAMGQITMSITNTSGGSSVVVDQGQSFDVIFRLDAAQSFYAVGAALSMTSPELDPGSHFFAVTSRTTIGPWGAGAVLSDDLKKELDDEGDWTGNYVSESSMLLGGGYLDPTTINIGYFDQTVPSNFTTGSYNVAQFTLSNAAAPGTYLISIGNPGGGINASTITGTARQVLIGEPLSVTVTPEPASLLLLGLGGLFLRRRRA